MFVRYLLPALAAVSLSLWTVKWSETSASRRFQIKRP